MDALRALLTPPSSTVSSLPMSSIISSSSIGDGDVHHNPVKAKKRAAFEAWHRRKLDQINGQILTNDISSRRRMEQEEEQGFHHHNELKKRLSVDSVVIVDRPNFSPSPNISSSENKNLADLIRDELQSSTPNPPPRPPSASSVLALPESTSNAAAKRLTAPKLSRHNDAAYYPNIQCILCKEWVCSRNRYMHIESHLQYRPYKCSVCGYDNRKEIFINLHIKKTHGNKAKVDYKPDPELEHRAWVMAEQCLQHTRDILSKQDGDQQHQQQAPSIVQPSDTILARYSAQFRPRIFNSQRAEKSQLIEESRQKGLVPDFSEVASREAQCQVCDGFVLASAAILEEHVRTHLSQPSYRCPIDDCTTEHHSKNFLTRHMKEVHKYRKPPIDLMDAEHEDMRLEFSKALRRSFPDHFTIAGGESKRRWKTRWTGGLGGDQAIETGGFGGDQSVESIPEVKPIEQTARRQCQLCQTAFPDQYSTLYSHVKTHLSVTPYQCSLCRFSDVNKATVLGHVSTVHGQLNGSSIVNRMDEWLTRQCSLLMAACFPDLITQPWLHDPPSVSNSS